MQCQAKTFEGIFYNLESTTKTIIFQQHANMQMPFYEER